MTRECVRCGNPPHPDVPTAGLPEGVCPRYEAPASAGQRGAVHVLDQLAELLVHAAAEERALGYTTDGPRDPRDVPYPVNRKARRDVLRSTRRKGRRRG